MKILIVEDEAAVAFQMEEILTSAGHYVVGFARDAEHALELAATLAPDLALVDFVLARGSSGATAAKYIGELCGIPSLFVSGNAAECRKVSRTTGALGCLSKPFQETELIEAVAAAESIIKGEVPVGLPESLELYTRVLYS